VEVVCVLRSGGPYHDLHVERLWNGIRNNSTFSSLSCLTDSETLAVPGVRVIPLEHLWPGWWSKIEMYRPGMFSGRVLYLDLDTVISGDLDFFLEWEGEKACLSDFNYPEDPATGVLLWCGDALSSIYSEFLADPRGVMGRHRRRSDYFTAYHFLGADRLQTFFPGKIVSYKRDCREGGRKSGSVRIPEEAAVICLHGPPRPHRLPEGDPVRLVWEGSG